MPGWVIETVNAATSGSGCSAVLDTVPAPQSAEAGRCWLLERHEASLVTCDPKKALKKWTPFGQKTQTHSCHGASGLSSGANHFQPLSVQVWQENPMRV